LLSQRHKEKQVIGKVQLRQGVMHAPARQERLGGLQRPRGRPGGELLPISSPKTWLVPTTSRSLSTL